MPNLSIRGNNTHVVDLNPTGDDPIIMLHGLFTHTAVFYFGVAPKLTENHRVVLYDLRGHGNSEECRSAFTLDDLLADLRELKAALGIGPCHLAGYSFGGALALYAVAKYPDEFKSLALIEAPLLDGIDADAMFLHEVDETSFDENFKAYTKSTGIPVPEAKAQKFLKQYRNLVEVGGIAEAFRFCSEQLASLPFEQMSLPVLLLYGRKSNLRKDGRLLRRRLPQSELHLAWADHNLPVTHDAWTARHLRAFFG